MPVPRSGQVELWPEAEISIIKPSALEVLRCDAWTVPDAIDEFREIGSVRGLLAFVLENSLPVPVFSSVDIPALTQTKRHDCCQRKQLTKTWRIRKRLKNTTFSDQDNENYIRKDLIVSYVMVWINGKNIRFLQK